MAQLFQKFYCFGRGKRRAVVWLCHGLLNGRKVTGLRQADFYGLSHFNQLRHLPKAQVLSVLNL